MSQKLPLFAKILAGFMICRAVLWLVSPYSDFAEYRPFFSYLTQDQAVTRFALSLTLRTVGLIAGVGILLHSHLCRKLGILLCWFSLATIYWKHPRALFERAADELIVKPQCPVSSCVVENMKDLDILITVSQVTLMIVDVLFFAVVLYYFTRPAVKAKF